MIQKKKFSDAIAANISVVGGLLPISTVLSIENIVGKTIAQVKQSILDSIANLNTQQVPIYITIGSGGNNVVLNWKNDTYVVESGGRSTMAIIGYYKTGGSFYASYELYSYSVSTIASGNIVNGKFV